MGFIPLHLGRAHQKHLRRGALKKAHWINCFIKGNYKINWLLVGSRESYSLPLKVKPPAVSTQVSEKDDVGSYQKLRPSAREKKTQFLNGLKENKSIVTLLKDSLQVTQTQKLISFISDSRKALGFICEKNDFQFRPISSDVVLIIQKSSRFTFPL